MSNKKSVIEKCKIKIKEPKKYKVIMFNDDFTSMEFVVFVLMNIFNKNNDEAVNIMMKVHKGGKAIVGVYSYDIAKSKVDKTMGLAREEGFHFKVIVEEA